MPIKGCDLKSLWNEEPVAILTAVQAFVVLLVTFGVDITKEQAGAILAFTAAVLGLITRRKVTPA
jgi:hypothetical protein